MRLAAATLLLALSALPARAVFDDAPVPPPSTPTATCPDGQVWNPGTSSCIDADDVRLDDEARLRAAHELVYAGRPGSALQVLAAIADRQDDRVLTLTGFAHRKAGDWERGRAFYDAAIARNPDNLLARSYLGMGLAERGDLDGARAQLREIVARGGRETWPHFALRSALRAGGTPAY